MTRARIVLREDGSISYALAAGTRAVRFSSDGHRHDTVLVLDGDAWGQREVDRLSGTVVTAASDHEAPGAMRTRSVEVTTLPDGSTRTRETHLDGTGRGDYTVTTRDPQGAVTDVEHGTISVESHTETDVEGHTVQVETTTVTRDPDAQGDTLEIVTSRSRDLDSGRTTDAKSITVTDPSGEVVYQDRDARTEDAEGNWSEAKVRTGPDGTGTSVDVRSGDKDSKPAGNPDPAPEPDPEPAPDPEPEPDGGEHGGRPADDATGVPHGPGGIVGRLIDDYVGTHGDEGDGEENRPGVVVGRRARDLVTDFLRNGSDGSEGSGVVVDLHLPVPPGAVDDWGDRDDPRMSTGFAVALAAVAARLEYAAARVAG